MNLLELLMKTQGKERDKKKINYSRLPTKVRKKLQKGYKGIFPIELPTKVWEKLQEENKGVFSINLAKALEKPCVQCQKETLFRCSNRECFVPICPDCSKPSKEIVILFLSNIPARLCEKCINKLPFEYIDESKKILDNITEKLRRFFE